MKVKIKFPVRRKGGPGSGHHGHVGRPGMVGGSSGGGSGTGSGGPPSDNNSTDKPPLSMYSNKIDADTYFVRDLTNNSGRKNSKRMLKRIRTSSELSARLDGSLGTALYLNKTGETLSLMGGSSSTSYKFDIVAHDMKPQRVVMSIQDLIQKDPFVFYNTSEADNSFGIYG